MKKTLTIVVSAVVILLVIIGIIFSLRSNGGESKNDQNVPEIVDLNEGKIVVPAKHQYKDGSHRIIGTIELPSPCHSYSVEVEGGVVPNVAVTITNPPEDRQCAQVIVQRDFDVSYTGPKEAIFTISINGQPASFNMFEIDPNDDIESVELFLKA